MEVIRISFNAIAPLCVFILLGLGLNRLNVLKYESARDLTMVVFRVLLPVQIFNSIRNADLKTAFNAKVVLFALSMYLITFFTSFYIVDRKETDNRIKPVMIQGMFKANFTLIALPLVTSLCAQTVGIASLMVGFNCIYANILSVFIFCFYCGKERTVGSVIFNLVKNPIIIASFLGFAFNLFHLKFPPLVEKSIIGPIASMATPVALIALGAALRIRSIGKYRKQAFAVVLIKLVVVPCVFIPLACLLGFRGEGLVTIAANAATPIAVNSYSLAVAMGGDDELADIIAVLSTLASMVTLFLIFCVLGLAVGFN